MLASQNKINIQTKVLKFGGSSVKDIGRLHHVADIIEARLSEGNLLVVVSAMGDTTDWLVNLAHRCTPEPDNRELDQLLATGEQVSIALLSLILRDRGIKARSLTGAQAGIVTDGFHNNARVVEVDTKTLGEHFDHNDVVIVAGFQGVSPNGDTTTLGRGGSDTSAVALAAAFNASCCDIYTDVDGILTADPRVISAASLLEEVCSEDAVEMARLGAQVIHPRAVELARAYRVPLRVRNTFKPSHVGTSIRGEEQMENYRAVTGIAIDGANAVICVSKLSGRVQAVPRILELLATSNIAVDLINQNLQTSDSVSFTVAQGDVARTIKVLQALALDFPGAEVSFDPSAAKVSVIGAGIATCVDIAAKAFGLLGRGGINIKLAATSDRRLTVVVAAEQSEAAARLLHAGFELDRITPFVCLQKTS
jgi:aspartate kinase